MCKLCDYADLIEKIDEMLQDDESVFDYADETLLGIRKWVSEAEHCTDKQKGAVENIRIGGETARDRKHERDDEY